MSNYRVEIADYRTTMWRQAGLSVLRDNGIMHVNMADIQFVYANRVETRVTFVDERERFLYELKGGDTWFLLETRKAYDRYLQETGL